MSGERAGVLRRPGRAVVEDEGTADREGSAGRRHGSNELASGGHLKLHFYRLSYAL